MPRNFIVDRRLGGNMTGHEEVMVYLPEKASVNRAPILVIHGNWATFKRNENFGKYFAQQGYVVIAPTHRFHFRGNENEQELGRISVLDYVRDHERLLQSLYTGKLLTGFEPSIAPVVIGHSLGGLIAQVLAHRHKLAASVLLCSAPPAGVSLHADKEYQRRIAKFAKEIFTGKPYLPDFDSLSQYVYNGMPFATHYALYEGAVYESGTSSREIIAGSGSGAARIIARILSKPIEVPDLGSSPSLIVGCENDRIIPPQIAHDLWVKYRERRGKTELWIAEERAHWPQTERNWEEVAERIYQWISLNMYHPLPDSFI